jgi:hypothetical protein
MGWWDDIFVKPIKKFVTQAQTVLRGSTGFKDGVIRVALAGTVRLVGSAVSVVVYPFSPDLAKEINKGTELLTSCIMGFCGMNENLIFLLLKIIFEINFFDLRHVGQ